MTLLEQFKTAREVYTTLLNEHHDEIMKQFITELGIEHTGLTNGMIVGYTPEWNDGEACEHSSDVQIRYMDNDITDFIEDIPEDYDDNSLSDQEGRAIEIKLAVLDEILVHIYGTNYKFGFIIQDGEITIKHEEYNCGY